VDRPADLSPTRGLGSSVAVWIALVAFLLNGVTGATGGRRPDRTPRVTKIKVPLLSRSDIGVPRFSNPARITNPLLPISQLTQVLQLGAEGGDELRFEVTLLPGTKTVEWDGRQVTTVVSQLVAYTNGQVVEVAKDFYAQADDGAVWHFGEEVANYDEGVLVDNEGSWLAGLDARPAMVMPGSPRVGDVFRSGNRPGQGPEEVTITSTDQTVDGPAGRIGGALLVREQLVDGTVEAKIFAPGYGEFNARVSSQDELYNVAVAVPTDAVPGAVPGELTTMSAGAERILAGGRPEPGGPGKMSWAQVTASLDEMTAAWQRNPAGKAPKMLVSQMNDRFADLVGAVAARHPATVQLAAIGVAQASLDLQLRHRPPGEVDRDRLRLGARQLQMDATSGDTAAVDSDVVVLDAVWARIGQPPGPARAPLDAALLDLQGAASARDLARVSTIAGSLPVP